MTETRKTLALLFDVTEAPKFWSKIVVDVVEEWSTLSRGGGEKEV